MKQRKSERVLIELPSKFCSSDKPDFWLDSTIMNISTHGFCFRTKSKYYEELNQCPTVHLVVEIEKGEELGFQVKVAWAGRTSLENCLVGGEILDASGPDYKKILELYARLLQTQ